MLKRIRNWFSKKPPQQIKTTPLSEDELRDAVKPSAHLYLNQISSAHLRSRGKQRDHNEDAIFTYTGAGAFGEVESVFGLYVVADGMGGHLNGALASATAAKVFGKAVLEKVLLPQLNQDPQIQDESIQEIMTNAVKLAQTAVQKNAPGGGTTLTAALVLGDQVTVAHVGDSRGYFIHLDRRIHLLTEDHSLVHRLVELGQLDEEMAKTHPQRNVLYRAIGQADPYNPDITTHPIPRPGYILLCSDGLWGVVNETEIIRMVLDSKNPASACQALIEAANDAGGPDNISVILAQFI